MTVDIGLNKEDYHKKYHYKPSMSKFKTYDKYKGISSKNLIHQYTEYMIKVFCGEINYLNKARDIAYYLIDIRGLEYIPYLETLNYSKYLLEIEDNIYYHIGIMSIVSNNEIVDICNIPIGYNKNSKIIKKHQYAIKSTRDLKPKH